MNGQEWLDRINKILGEQAQIMVELKRIEKDTIALSVRMDILEERKNLASEKLAQLIKEVENDFH